MKTRLLRILACPECKSDLKLIKKIEEDSEIKEGVLICQTCKKSYHIHNFIPRLLPEQKKILVETAECFRFEWERFAKLNPSSEMGFFCKKLGMPRDHLSNKLILDVGCGKGRYTYIASTHAKWVIGLDITQAVDYARIFTKMRNNIDFVQADAAKLPFKEGVFDCVYSFGVLHHTPDPYKSFKEIPRVLKKEGVAVVWLYAYWGVIREALNTAVRVITKRLPHKLLWWLSYLPLPLTYIPLVKEFSRLLPISSGAPTWRQQQIDIFDRWAAQIEHKHTVPEIVGWYEQNNFKNITVTSPTWYEKKDVKVLHPNSGYPRGIQWLFGKYDSVGILGIKK